VATINSNPKGNPSSAKNQKIVDDSEFIAMMESFDMPLYFILYDISYVQYVYSERVFTSGG
jgi:hypothetical protein